MKKYPSTSYNKSTRSAAYVFWLFGIKDNYFGRINLSRSSPLVKCIINQTGVYIDDSNTSNYIQLDRNNIDYCRYNWWASPLELSIVTIKLFDGKKYSLAPVNPIGNIFGFRKEAKNIVQVVNQFLMNGELIDIEPNPYLRAFKRLGIPPTKKVYTHTLWSIKKHPEPDLETWDPDIDPRAYHNRYKKRYTILEIIGWIIITIVSSVVAILLLAWIAGGF